MTPPRILLTRPFPFAAADRLPADWPVAVAGGPAGVDRDALRVAMAGCDALLCLLTDTIDAELIDAAPRLRLIANAGAGFNNIAWAHARDRGVMVTNTPGVLTDATADLAMALILAAARRVVEGDRFLRAGQFQGLEMELLLGMDLRQAVLGIVGLGRIGQALARRAAPFGLRVVYTQRTPLPPAQEAELGATRVDLDTLLTESDIISLNCPLTPETHHLIDAAALRRVKPGAILINTARGPVVDEAALAAALRSGHLRAAGLDVYEREPVVHPDLLGLENVVLLPHIGSATDRTRRDIVHRAVDNVVRFFTHGQAIDPVY